MTVKVSINLARVAYNSFVREAGFAKDARIMEFDKLASFQRERWRTVAADIITAWEADNSKRVSQEYARRVHAEGKHQRKITHRVARPRTDSEKE